MKYLVLVIIPFLFACQERFRYPCQDPKNWEEEFCKKPYCSANGTCPEDLRHYEKNNNKSNQPSCQGSCR
jgi:hypothetical protein